MREDLNNYRKIWVRRSILRDYSNILMGRPINHSYKGSKSLNPEILKEVDMTG